MGGGVFVLTEMCFLFNFLYLLYMSMKHMKPKAQLELCAPLAVRILI